MYLLQMPLILLLRKREARLNSVQDSRFFLLPWHSGFDEVFHCFVVDVLLGAEVFFLVVEESEVVGDGGFGGGGAGISRRLRRLLPLGM